MGETSDIVLIDDDEFIVDIVSVAFETDPNIRLVRCRTAQEGLDVLENTEPAVIVLDLGLPDIDGIELIIELERRGIVSKTPVIVLSGNDDLACRRKALAAGATAFIAKPFYPNRLRDIITRYAEAGTGGD